jgi:hypothetical protein
MKYLIIPVFALLSLGATGQTKTIPKQEKICFITHHYKCSMCGKTFEEEARDFDQKIKNPQIKANYDENETMYKMVIMSEVKEKSSDECNASRNGKHTWNEEKTKNTKSYVLIRVNANGQNEEVK